MEIIHLILGKANPDRMNGVNKVVNEMATHQVQQGYSVEVWGITANPLHDYPSRNFTTRLFRAFRNPFCYDPEIKKAFQEKKGSIVVHIHGAFLPVFYSISRMLHREKIPFIITPHSTYNKVMMKKNALRKKIYFRWFEKPLLDRAAYIHLLGQSEWEGLGAIYHNRKSLIIPYGFSRMKHLAAPEKASLFSVVYCGRLAIHPKGLDILLEGFALFVKKHPDTQLILIGDGKERDTLSEMCRDLGLNTSVIFKGSLFGEEKIKLLQQAHVFAHPSRTDGLPATILEAAALGLPCVVSEATNMGAFIDTFDAGYTMKNMEPGEFCRGLCRLYDRIVSGGEGELLEWNASNMIDTAFDWKGVIKDLSQVYRRSLEPCKKTA